MRVFFYQLHNLFKKSQTAITKYMSLPKQKQNKTNKQKQKNKNKKTKQKKKKKKPETKQNKTKQNKNTYIEGLSLSKYGLKRISKSIL